MSKLPEMITKHHEEIRADWLKQMSSTVRRADLMSNEELESQSRELMDAIVSGTGMAAEALRLQDKLGSIKEGLQADIVAVRGNPIQDITAVRNLVFVMKGGKVYRNDSMLSH